MTETGKTAPMKGAIQGSRGRALEDIRINMKGGKTDYVKVEVAEALGTP